MAEAIDGEFTGGKVRLSHVEYNPPPYRTLHVAGKRLVAAVEENNPSRSFGAAG